MPKYEPIIVEETLNADIQFVWESITELDHMKRWFFDNIPDFQAKVGFKTAFNVESGERSFKHQLTLVEVSPHKKIVYDWRYLEYSGEALLTFELYEEEAKTKVIVMCDGIESFPQEIPEFKRESCLAGWNYFIKERLKNYINAK